MEGEEHVVEGHVVEGGGRWWKVVEGDAHVVEGYGAARVWHKVYSGRQHARPRATRQSACRS